jgi:hypothetical protein
MCDTKEMQAKSPSRLVSDVFESNTAWDSKSRRHGPMNNRRLTLMASFLLPLFNTLCAFLRDDDIETNRVSTVGGKWTASILLLLLGRRLLSNPASRFRSTRTRHGLRIDCSKTMLKPSRIGYLALSCPAGSESCALLVGSTNCWRESFKESREFC